jgi:A/G-specific adenine glycosylase
MPARTRTDAAAVTAALDVPAIRRSVLAWYDATGRALPFRGVTDAWAILVSEAMAQQTQATRAGEAWRTFMAAFPTPAALASASPAEVLRAWRGLGYNRRALSLRAAAIAVVRDHGGRVPDDLDALRRLPGVGPYTARAVAALAYGRPVGAVDTNVRRVLGRLVASAPSDRRAPRTGTGNVAPAERPARPGPAERPARPGPAERPARPGPAAIQSLADALVDPVRPGAWTHALMDVGARVCRASVIECGSCPLEAWCRTAAGRRADASGALPASPARPRTAAMAGQARRRGAHPTAVREARVPYAASSRWLRGRLVDRLRDAPGSEWVRLEGPVGDHDPIAVADTIAALERDGLLERHPDDPRLIRLPVAAAAPRSR